MTTPRISDPMTAEELSAVVNIWIELNKGLLSDASDMATMFVDEMPTALTRARRARFLMFLTDEGSC